MALVTKPTGTRGEPEFVPHRPRLLLLSRQEQAILARLAQGLSGPEIAALAAVSLPTVKTHLTHIYQKLGVKNRVQAALVWQKKERWWYEENPPHWGRSRWAHQPGCARFLGDRAPHPRVHLDWPNGGGTNARRDDLSDYRLERPPVCF